MGFWCGPTTTLSGWCPISTRCLRKPACSPLYLCRVAPIVEDGELQGDHRSKQEGRHAIRARVVVDATGDTDVAAFAGASFESGARAMGAIQSISAHALDAGLPA